MIRSWKHTHVRLLSGHYASMLEKLWNLPGTMSLSDARLEIQAKVTLLVRGEYQLDLGARDAFDPDGVYDIASTGEILQAEGKL